jgi:RHS repeat-associated protein
VGGQNLTYGYDNLGRLESVQGGFGTYSYGYLGASHLPHDLTRPDGSVTTYAYDNVSRLTQVDNRNSLAAILNQYTYTYDDRDLRATEARVDSFSMPSLPSELIVHDYSDVNQLTGGSFAYDDDGNMTQGQTPDGYVFTATYDARNRLTSLEYTDGAAALRRTEYRYNGDDVLSSVAHFTDGVPNGERRYVNAATLSLQERDEANLVLGDYTWGLGLGGGIEGLLHMNRGGSDYSYLYDGKGNVTSVLDGGGSPVAEYLYGPFGALLAETGTLDQEFRFSTKRYDDATGLSYYGYRFYSPALRRWLTRDPIGELGGPNLYAFVNDNPVNRVDSVGRNPQASTNGPLAQALVAAAAAAQLVGADEAANQALAQAAAALVAGGPSEYSVPGLIAHAANLQLFGEDEAADAALAEAGELAVAQGPGGGECPSERDLLEYQVTLQLLGVE